MYVLVFGDKEKTMGLGKIYFKYLNKTTIITVLISLYFSVILEFFSAIFNDLPCLREAEDRGREAEGWEGEAGAAGGGQVEEDEGRDGGGRQGGGRQCGGHAGGKHVIPPLKLPHLVLPGLYSQQTKLFHPTLCISLRLFFQLLPLSNLKSFFHTFLQIE